MIEKKKGVSDSLLKKIKEQSSGILEPYEPSGSSIVFQDTEVTVACRIQTIMKQEYMLIEYIHGTSPDHVKEGIEACCSYKKEKMYRGVLTNTVQNDSIYSQVFKRMGFKKGENVYSIERSSIRANGTRQSTLSLEEFGRKNRSEKKGDLTTLLLEYDNEQHKLLNASYGYPMYRVGMKMDRAQKIRISYFVETLLNDPHWTTYLAYDEDECVGFVKGKETDGVCRVELYLKKKYRERYSEECFGRFVHSLGKEVKHISAYIPSEDTFMIKAMERWLGKPEGYRWFWF